MREKKTVRKTMAIFMTFVFMASVMYMPKEVKGDMGTYQDRGVTGNPATDSDFVIAKKQLALTNGLRFYLKADKTLFTEDGYTNPTMVIDFNNGETVISNYVEEAQYYAFPFNNIAPHQMGYTFSATLHAYKDGVEYVSPTLEYSVEQYCYDVFNVYQQYNYNDYAKLYTLLVDLLNYGAQAQMYTNTDTDNLVNSDLTAEQQSHATTISGDFVNSRNYNYETIDNPGVTWQAAALNLRDSIVMRLRFSAPSIDGLTVKARDAKGTEWEIESADFESAGSGTYNVYFDQFNVGRMSDIVYLTVYNGETPVSNTCSFSIESYAAVIQQNAATYPDLALLTTAMMKYGKSAKDYSSNNEPTTTEQTTVPEETTIEQTTAPAETTTSEIVSKPVNEEPTVPEVIRTVSGINATVTFSGSTATLSGSNLSGISVAYDSATASNTISITKVGKYKLTGTTSNAIVDVKKSLSGNVEIILDNCTINNSTYAQTKGSDAPIIGIGKDTNTIIDLIGESTLTGSSTFVTTPQAVISQKGSPTLTIYNSGGGILNVTDSMPANTNYGSQDPSDGIATKGELIIKSGVINVTANGDALKGTGDTGSGGVTIENGTCNLQSMKSSAIKSKNGVITISGGTINSNYTADDAIKATNYDIGISGGTVNINNCQSDGIQADGITISGGYVDVNTYFENAGLNYYNSDLPVHNSMNVVVGGDSHALSETVNIDTGSHTGIKAGTKAEKYKYLSVAAGSTNVAGQTYLRPATGGITISGGTVCVDTTNTGIKYNVKKSEGQYTGNLSFANNDGQYIIGSPGDGIESNNNFDITGGTVFIKSADDGITAEGTLTITGDSVVNVEQAYEGIEASAIIVGTNGSTSATPHVSAYTINDGINTAVKSITTYIYDDETESSYSKTSESIMANNDMTVYSGTVVAMIGDDTVHTFSLPVVDGQGVVPVGTVTSTYTADGDGIDCNGSLYAYGGTIIVWGSNTNKNSPIDTGDNNASYVIGAGATVFASASVDSKTNYPTSLGQNAVLFSGFGIPAGREFAILNSSQNVSIAGKTPKASSYIFYSAPNMTGLHSLLSGGSVSGKVNNYSIHDGRYNTYSSSGASALRTCTASTNIGS